MIIAILATWSLFNVAFAGCLTWVRVNQLDREKERRAPLPMSSSRPERLTQMQIQHGRYRGPELRRVTVLAHKIADARHLDRAKRLEPSEAVAGPPWVRQ